MPLNLSKEDVARLSEEQLDAYARVYLDSERTRRELLDRACGRNRSFVVPCVACVLGAAAAVWFPSILRDPINLVALAIVSLFAFHRSTNRRIDALVRLLDLDRVAEEQTAEQGTDGKPSVAAHPPHQINPNTRLP